MEPAERAGGRDPLEPGGRPGPDPQGRPAEGDRLQQAAALRRSGWTPSPTCSWLRSKATWPGGAAPRAVAWGPLLDQETLHVSVPGLQDGPEAKAR